MKFNSYISLVYLGIFLPATLFLYAVMPKKVRPYVLLTASLTFFWFISEYLIFYFITSVLLIWLCALGLDRLKRLQKDRVDTAQTREEKKQIKKVSSRKQLTLVVVCILVNIGILAVLKYSPFFLTNLNLLFSTLGTHRAFLLFVASSFLYTRCL